MFHKNANKDKSLMRSMSAFLSAQEIMKNMKMVTVFVMMISIELIMNAVNVLKDNTMISFSLVVNLYAELTANISKEDATVTQDILLLITDVKNVLMEVHMMQLPKNVITFVKKIKYSVLKDAFVQMDLLN